MIRFEIPGEPGPREGPGSLHLEGIRQLIQTKRQGSMRCSSEMLI